MLLAKLFETESDDVGIGQDSRALRQILGDRLDRPRAVGELPDGGGSAVQAMRFLALEVVDDDLVEDRIDSQPVASGLRKFGHADSPEP